MGVGALRWWCGLCSLAVRETGIAFAGMVGAGGETRVAFAGVNGPVLGGWSRAMVLWVSCVGVSRRVLVLWVSCVGVSRRALASGVAFFGWW